MFSTAPGQEAIQLGAETINESSNAGMQNSRWLEAVRPPAETCPPSDCLLAIQRAERLTECIYYACAKRARRLSLLCFYRHACALLLGKILSRFSFVPVVRIAVNEIGPGSILRYYHCGDGGMAEWRNGVQHEKSFLARRKVSDSKTQKYRPLAVQLLGSAVGSLLRILLCCSRSRHASFL